MTKQTTISIHEKTKARLVKKGTFSESMNDLINRILDENDKK